MADRKSDIVTTITTTTTTSITTSVTTTTTLCSTTVNDTNTDKKTNGKKWYQRKKKDKTETKSSGSTKSTESTKSTKTTKSTRSSKATKLTRLIKSAKSSKSRESTKMPTCQLYVRVIDNDTYEHWSKRYGVRFGFFSLHNYGTCDSYGRYSISCSSESCERMIEAFVNEYGLTVLAIDDKSLSKKEIKKYNLHFLTRTVDVMTGPVIFYDSRTKEFEIPYELNATGDRLVYYHYEIDLLITILTASRCSFEYKLDHVTFPPICPNLNPDEKSGENDHTQTTSFTESIGTESDDFFGSTELRQMYRCYPKYLTDLTNYSDHSGTGYSSDPCKVSLDFTVSVASTSSSDKDYENYRPDTETTS